jgi:hypothetical protein
VIGFPDQGAIRARLTGRSYWRLRYTDGRVLSEWELDWSLAPRRGRQALRLHCPNGQVAELGDANGGEVDGRLFQFKDAAMYAGARSETLAHVVGLVDTTNGDCKYAAWLYGENRLVTGRSNVFNFSYNGVPVGALAFEHLGIAPD